mgnify:FL=1
MLFVLGWFAFILFASEWMATRVYGGDASAPSGPAHDEYERGLRAASLALSVNAGITMLMGLGKETQPHCK